MPVVNATTPFGNKYSYDTDKLAQWDTLHQKDSTVDLGAPENAALAADLQQNEDTFNEYLVQQAEEVEGRQKLGKGTQILGRIIDTVVIAGMTYGIGTVAGAAAGAAGGAAGASAGEGAAAGAGAGDAAVAEGAVTATESGAVVSGGEAAGAGAAGGGTAAGAAGSSTLDTIGSGALQGFKVGTGVGAVKGAVTGKNIFQSALEGGVTGAVSGGISAGVSEAANAAGLGDVTNSQLGKYGTRFGVGTGVNLASGQKPLDALGNAALSTGVSYGLDQSDVFGSDTGSQIARGLTSSELTSNLSDLLGLSPSAPGTPDVGGNTFSPTTSTGSAALGQALRTSGDLGYSPSESIFGGEDTASGKKVWNKASLREKDEVGQ